LAFSTVAMNIPSVAAKTSFTLSTLFYAIIGVNSPHEISWLPSSATSPLLLSPAYVGKTSVWANATVTFTRPDGTTQVVNGPFVSRPDLVQGREPDVILFHTPNMMGTWRVNFYWPGDDSFNSVNQTDTFSVGQHYQTRAVFAKLSMKPYPAVGLGQNLLINAWITPPPGSARDYYMDYKFTFTSPSGSSFVVGPMNSEAPGTVWFDLPLNELGNWAIKFEFPGDSFNLPASITRTITVQKDPVIDAYPETPLPSTAWDFPINTENREWRTIAGSWKEQFYNASQGSWNPYTQAPRTAHVLWKLSSSGQLGGFIGSPHSIETGGGVEAYGAGDAGLFTSTVPTIRTVMAGRGYYTAGGNIICLDMQTGKTLWNIPGSFDIGADRGRTTVLYSFGSRFIAYDAITGAVTLNVTGMAMNRWVDPYVISINGSNLIKWETTSTSTNFATRIMWNVTNILPSTATSASVIYDNLYIGMRDRQSLTIEGWLAINLTTGAMEYNTTVIDLTNTDTWSRTQGPAMGAGFGKIYRAFIAIGNEGLAYKAFDAKTGKQAWISEKTDDPWGGFWAYLPQASAYGMNFGLSYGGVYAFNLTNGKIVWHYIDYDAYHEEPYGSNVASDKSTYASYSFGSTGPVIGGGLVFAPNSEHSPTLIYRGQQLHAIDAFTGKKVWSVLGAYTPTAIAYGILLASDSYNGYSYAFGKGETATKILASTKIAARGAPILIEGTVLDRSPAQEGTAAVSDASQTPWMEYLHMQQPKPTNATGVKVHLTALDSNGNIQEIGTVTSDLSGIFRKGWTPPIEGEYTIYASFDGSESYYGSQAETVLFVGPTSASPNVTPTFTPTIESPTPPQTSTPLVSPTPAVEPPKSGAPTTTYVAIAGAVILISVAAAALVLRKRRK
jgi:outer membrane protein assembly factor BamB